MPQELRYQGTPQASLHSVGGKSGIMSKLAEARPLQHVDGSGDEALPAGDRYPINLFTNDGRHAHPAIGVADVNAPQILSDSFHEMIHRDVYEEGKLRALYTYGTETSKFYSLAGRFDKTSSFTIGQPSRRSSYSDAVFSSPQTMLIHPRYRQWGKEESSESLISHYGLAVQNGPKSLISLSNVTWQSSSP
ncbi:15768_t:CDS:2 [Acaulospora colombiana]|uniref:15768_t:CDS:1 n=1 Tax=Acaulospora colombiana TaxID=27376 RepID=A0ACA9N130_9GLOM|nr:15768_t:CDS:2 [Acaulospora colombiana]